MEGGSKKPQNQEQDYSVENPSAKLLKNLIINRLGLVEEDLIPIGFPKFLEMYDDFETAAIFYEEYYLYQRRVYGDYMQELEEINSNGIKLSEFRLNQALSPYFTRKERKLPQNYSLFYQHIMDQYRNYNVARVSISDQQVQLQQYYAEFELLNAKFLNTHVEEENNKRHIESIIVSEENKMNRSAILKNKLESSLSSAQERHKQQLQQKQQRAKNINHQLELRKLAVKTEIEIVVKRRAAQESTEEKLMLSNKVKSLLENQNKEIHYTIKETNQHYNEDKNERKKLAEQRRKDRLNQALQDKYQYKAYLSKQAEIQQLEVERQAKINEVIQRSRSQIQNKMKVQLERLNSVKDKQRVKDDNLKQREYEQYKKQLVEQREIQSQQLAQRREKSEKQKQEQLDKMNREISESKMKSSIDSMDTSRSSLKYTLQKQVEMDAEQQKYKQAMLDIQKAKSIKYQMKSLPPTSAAYAQLAQEYIKLSSKCNYDDLGDSRLVSNMQSSQLYKKFSNQQ